MGLDRIAISISSKPLSCWGPTGDERSQYDHEGRKAGGECQWNANTADRFLDSINGCVPFRNIPKALTAESPVL
jgi:hypothetical protein